MPTSCISAAMATTSSSAAAVKISGVLLRAIQRSSGRSNSRPPRMMPAITPTIFSASSARSRPLIDCSAAVAPASSGSSARIGIAATSWNSRIEKPAWPLVVLSRLRSPNTCSAMAVDESASPSEATSATRHSAPTAQPTAKSTAAQLSTCAAPQPKMGRRRFHRRLGSSSRPTRNSISTTPNSAKCTRSPRWTRGPAPTGRWRCRPRGSR